MPSSHFTLSTARSGVSLILALGVLSLLILVVTAFTVTMRIEHLAARNARDKVRSRQYLHAGLSLASESIAGQLVGQFIPSRHWSPTNEADDTVEFLDSIGKSDWTVPIASQDMTNGPFLASGGYLVPDYTNLLPSMATNLLPPGLRTTALAMPAGWTYIISTNSLNGGERRISGRVAYLAVDLSGQLDIHHLTTNQYCDLAAVDPDSAEVNAFMDDRARHLPYRTVSETHGNLGLYSDDGTPLVPDEVLHSFLDALGVYSYDPNPDQIAFAGWIGDRGTVLVTNKFDLHSVTNDLPGGFRSASEASPEYAFAVTNVLSSLGFDETEAKALYWNLLNYLDEDRIPQTDTDHPWLDSYGVEAVPLVNELVLRQADGQPSNHYELAIELWYPFAPSNSPPNAALNAEFRTHTEPSGFIDPQDGSITNLPIPELSYTEVPQGAAPDNPFFVTNTHTSLSFPVIVTNYPPQIVTNFLPLGEATFTNHLLSDEGEWLGMEIHTVTNTVVFHVRVALDGIPLDEAPGPSDDPGLEDVDPWSVTNTFSRSVVDPRRNGRTGYWHNQPETLGATNANFAANIDPALFQGLPLLHRDGLMATIGEIGYLGTDRPWESLDLISTNNLRGAALLDLWTANLPGSNDVQWAQGRIHALTEYPAAIRAMFADTVYGTNRFVEGAASNPINTVAADSGILDSLTNVLLNVRTEVLPFPTNDTPWVAQATFPFAEWLPRLAAAPSYPSGTSDFTDPPGYDVPGRDLLEDLIRDLPDRVTFRQNLILVFVRAQALAPNGRVTADSASVALMVRDSYTGLWAYRYILPLH